MTSDKSVSAKTLTPSASGVPAMRPKFSLAVSCFILRFVVVMMPWNPLGLFGALKRSVYLSV